MAKSRRFVADIVFLISYIEATVPEMTNFPFSVLEEDEELTPLDFVDFLFTIFAG